MVPAAAVAAEYCSSLARQATAAASLANAGTAAAAAAVGQEFAPWLEPRAAARGATLLTCTPEDVVVFFESHWLPRHGSTVLEDGETHASPAYLDTSVSHLSGLFRRWGARGITTAPPR